MLLETKGVGLLVICVGSTSSVSVKRGNERVNVKSTSCLSLASVQVGILTRSSGIGIGSEGTFRQISPAAYLRSELKCSSSRPASAVSLKHTTMHSVACLRQSVPEQNLS